MTLLDELIRQHHHLSPPLRLYFSPEEWDLMIRTAGQQDVTAWARERLLSEAATKTKKTRT